MSRPRLRRRLCVRPGSFYYKPRGIPMHQLEITILTREEMEAIWLVDARYYDQVRAAKHMWSSQSPIQRILKEGRKKIAQVLSEGRAVVIETH